ncbi:hypothetical protein ACTMTI_07460 [Nonomuraea sp. H19]|uniref:hypothetical protein n=1 Tax=Nonomuraea sp. H19 TaxID=3452206 RepID=UPI003F8BB171
MVNTILYVVRSGCPWRYLPTDLLSVTWNQAYPAIMFGTVSPVAKENCCELLFPRRSGRSCDGMSWPRGGCVSGRTWGGRSRAG